MGIILFTFNAVVPLFLLAGVGILLRRSGYMNDAFASRLNRICFLVMIPCNLFRTIYNSKFEISLLYLVLYALLANLAIIAALCLLVPRLFRGKKQIATIVHGMFRPNITMLGLPLVASLLGSDHTVPMALLIAFLSPCFTIAGVIVFTVFSEREERITPAEILGRIFKNPLMISTLLGAAFNFAHISLPPIVMKPVSDLATVATPLSMIAMGARFSLKSLTSNRFTIAFASVGRLLVIPGLIVTGGILLGFRGDALCALYIATGAPTAVASVAMADSMGGDGRLASEIVMVTTAFSLLTIFTVMCLLLATGLV